MARGSESLQLFSGDCVEQSRAHLKPESVDLIITDPPYGIDGDKLHRHYNRDESYVVEGYVEIPRSEYSDFSERWIAEAARVLRPGGAIYLVSGYTNLPDVMAALRKSELSEVNHLIWKYNFGVYTSRKFVSSHYHILYYEKPGGRRTFNLESRYSKTDSSETGSANYQDREDVWIINREYKPGQRKNKNELPDALLLKMLQYSTNEGDLVVDFFMGGGSTGRMALALNRHFAGFEVSATAFEHASNALKQIEPGHLLGSVGQPNPARSPENEGAPWTEADYERLIQAYDRLRRRGLKKKATVAELCALFGRGYWSIEKALKKMEGRGATARDLSLFPSHKA